MTGRTKTALIVCAASWAIVALWGGYRYATGLPDRVQQARLDETSRRQSSWSPISSFAQSCAASVPSGARVLLLDITDRPQVTDPNSRTGPAAFGAPNDVDWPNQAAFSYTLYPRLVDPLGHLPTFPIATRTTPYVALWDQATYRSSDARADSAIARQQLSSIPQGSIVCSYSDGIGNRGWIFATGAGIASAAQGGPGPQSLTASGLALTLLGLGVLWATGALILGALGRGGLSPGLWAAVALPMGCVAVTVQMLIFSISGIRWSLAALLAPWIVVAALTAWRRPKWIRRLLSWRPTTVRLDRYELIAIVGLIGSLVVVAGASPLALPQSDGFSMYYFKANAFFVDGSVIPFYRHAADLLFSFPAHPPLIPLSVTWLYLFIGQVQERSSLLLWPALYVSLIGSLYALVRTRIGRKPALWYVLTASFVASGLLGEATGSGFTDMPLALFLLLGAGCLWLWASSDRRSWVLPVVAGVFLGAAALTKEEGLLGTAVVVAATPLLTWAGGKFRWDALRPGLAAGAVAAGVVSIWIVLRLTYRLPVLTVDLGAKLESVVQRLLPALTGLGLRAAPQLGLVVILVAAAIAARRRDQSFGQMFNQRFRFLAVIALALLAADVLALAIAPVEIGYQVQVAAGRLISQAMPVILLAVVQPWRLLLAAAPPIHTKENGNGEHIDAFSGRLRPGASDRSAIRAGRSTP